MQRRNFEWIVQKYFATFWTLEINFWNKISAGSSSRFAVHSLNVAVQTLEHLSINKEKNNLGYVQFKR